MEKPTIKSEEDIMKDLINERNRRANLALQYNCLITEYDKLLKQFDLACDYISDYLGECPMSRCVYDDRGEEIDMENYFDCQNCKDNYVECWKKHYKFLVEKLKEEN